MPRTPRQRAPLAIRREPLSGSLPRITFIWDSETEILSGRFPVDESGRGLTGSVEYEGADGTFVLMEVERGTVCGLEVVVWPPVEDRPDLSPPPATPARLTIPARASQPGISAVEVEQTVGAEASRDERTIRIRVGEDRERDALQLADNLIVELDANDDVAGFWLLNVPDYPEAEP